MVTRFDALATVCRPFVTFEGLPKGLIFAGQRVQIMVRLFGKLPAQLYFMEIAALGENAMRFPSNKKGAGVRAWNHRLHLVPDGDRTRLVEEIEIDAGLLTPIFALWARVLYHGRHGPRSAPLRQGMF